MSRRAVATPARRPARPADLASDAAPALRGSLAARRRLTRAGPRDAGTVTAELALGMLAVVLVLSALLVTSAAVATRMRCLDAARAAARVAVTGAPEPEVVAAARRVLPDARVELAPDGPWLEVTVTATVGGAWFTDGGLTVTGSATGWVEPWGG